MRRLFLACGAVILALTASSSIARADQIYRLKFEWKYLGLQPNGKYLKERHRGLSKYNKETTEWSSIFETADTIKEYEMYNLDEDYVYFFQDTDFATVDTEFKNFEFTDSHFYTTGRSGGQEKIYSWNLRNGMLETFDHEIFQPHWHRSALGCLRH